MAYTNVGVFLERVKCPYFGDPTTAGPRPTIDILILSKYTLLIYRFPRFVPSITADISGSGTEVLSGPGRWEHILPLSLGTRAGIVREYCLTPCLYTWSYRTLRNVSPINSEILGGSPKALLQGSEVTVRNRTRGPSSLRRVTPLLRRTTDNT